MKKLIIEELYKILKNHKVWIETGGKKGRRADLQWADLRGANLHWAELQRAKLQKANLIGAKLQKANLIEANLQRTDLRKADLRGANLQGTDLRRANLQEANLQEAVLRGANLNKIDLSQVRSFWKCIGNGKEIKNISLNSDEYNICYTSNRLQIGCCLFKISEWEKFSDDEILAFDKKQPQEGLAWWKENKDEIFRTIKKNPAE